MLVYAYVLMSTYNLENRESVKGEEFFFSFLLRCVCVGWEGVVRGDKGSRRGLKSFLLN